MLLPSLLKMKSLIFPSTSLFVGYRLQPERFGTVAPGDLFDVQRSEADFLCSRTNHPQQQRGRDQDGRQ